MITVKKRYYILSALFIFLFIVFFFLSTIIKIYIVNNSENIIGRKFTLEKLHFNYFKVEVKVGKLTVFEENKKDTFIYFQELSINYDPWKILKNEYAVSEIRLIDPYVYVQKNDSVFNFSNLIEETGTKDTLTHNEENIKFSIKNITLENGEFLYYDSEIDNLLEFDNLNIELPLIAWNSQNSEMGVQFSIGESGIVKIAAEINQQQSEYNIQISTKDIQLKSFTNYLKEYTHISNFQGYLQSNIGITGDINQVDNISILGNIGVDSLSFTDDKDNPIFSAKSITTKLNSVELKSNQININNIDIIQPVIYAVLNKDMSNLEYFFMPVLADTLTTEIKDSIQSASDEINFLYKIDTFAIHNGQIKFTDNTLNRKFKYDVNNINASLNNVFEKNDKIPLKFSMNFNNEGKYAGEALFSLKNPQNISYKGIISELDLHSFSPYTEYFIGYPILSGLYNFDCSIEMSPSKLVNKNSILIKEMEFGKKTKDSTVISLPVKLALYLIKDSNDNIDINLPVNGNPSEPGFKLGPLIWKTFGKFIVKTSTQPFNSLAKLVGTSPEELEKIPFEYSQDSLMPDQRKTLDKIAKILTKKDDLIFSFRQEVSVDDELLILAEKKIKSKYIEEKSVNNMTWKDVKDDDAFFLTYLNKLSTDTSQVKLKETYYHLIPENELMTSFKNLYNNRNELIKQYLINTKQCNNSSIKISNVDFNNMPKEIKKPSFRVEVSVK